MKQSLFSLVSLTTSSLALSLPSPGLLVPTPQGLVQGTLPSSTVRQFLGIPYASIPARFIAPAAAKFRTGILQANAFGPSCPQDMSVGNTEFLNIIGLTTPLPQSEDCLSLNIWAPSVGRRTRTAVMVWVHGGGFQFGSSDIAAYNGHSFVQNNDDITIVTINYRLGIFGSPQSPQLLSKKNLAQNMGLQDIDAAITWVFDNIAAFGGDPERITIFGESAGAAAVDAYAFAHPHDNKVKGIICESGQSAGARAAIPDPTLATSPWNTVANLAGCGLVDDAKQFSCMQKAPFLTLRDIESNLSLPFSVIPDGITFFADGLNRSAAGEFLKVPLMTGNNANEEDIFLLITDILTNTTTPNFDAVSDATTAAGFACPAARQATDREKAGVTAFRYRYEALFANLNPLPILRVFHSSEIALVFGTFGADTVTKPGVPTTADEAALSRYMQSAWVTFARDPANGLKNNKTFGWPSFNPTSKTSLVELGNAKNPTGATFGNPSVFDSVCNFSVNNPE